MKSAIFLTWFFTIIFFSHGLNSSGAGTSCSVPPAVKHIAQAAATTPPVNRLQPVALAQEPAPAPAEMITTAYAANEIEPAASETPPHRFDPRQHTTSPRLGADAETYSQNKEDLLLQALMK